MKIALIQAFEPEKTGIFDYEYPPMGLLYLASYIKKYSNIEIFLCQEVEEIFQQSPDIVGISANSINFKEAVKISEEIKRKHNVPVIIGGPHITILPYSLHKKMDIGVIGEGEETFLELLNIYIKDNNFNRENLSEVKGIVYREKELKINEPRSLIEPLDLIPLPDRHINNKIDFTPCIITSRGCPYNCTFCSLSSCWKKVRLFSTEYVKNELLRISEDLTSYPHIRILDDVFTLNKQRLICLKDFIIKNSIQKKATFDCSIRADIFSEEICRILKKMNVTRILLGAESASEKILHYYNKRQSVDDIQRVIDLCYKFHIELTASFIIGAPAETQEDLMETYNFIKKNRKKFWKVHIQPLDPLPGTKIWDYVKGKGLVTDYDREIKNLNLSEYIKDEEFNNYIKMFEDLVCNDIEKRFKISQEILTDLYGN